MTTIKVTNELYVTAKYLAKKRLLYEYPRKGYGKYQNNSHLENLTNGYLGELAFLEWISNNIEEEFRKEISELNNNYSEEIATNLFIKINNKKFSWNLVIGQPDEGYDFKIKDYLIDIKTYGTDYFLKSDDDYISQKTKKKLQDLNLLIDKRQGIKWKNNNKIVFIQCFIAKNEKNEINEVIIAGWHKGLPELNKNFPQPAYVCKVKELNDMTKFKTFLLKGE